jgi:hypothetical protein
MTFKTMALAGSAAIALGAAAGFAYPAHSASTAQENRQEQSITQQLNEQQLQHPGAVAATADSGDQMAQSSDNGSSDNSSNAASTPSTADRTVATVGNEVDKAVGPDKPVTNAEMRKAVSLTEVSNPAATLATAEIKNRKGQALGEVKSVDVATDGKVKAVKADVGGFLGVGEREVSLDARDLVYLKDRNLIVTDMTKPQIENLPPVSKSY